VSNGHAYVSVGQPRVQHLFPQDVENYERLEIDSNRSQNDHLGRHTHMDGQPENIMHLVPYIGCGRHNEVQCGCQSGLWADIFNDSWREVCGWALS